MDINQLIAHNGACFYLIIFVWTFLEGETIILFAGFAAAQGLVDPLLLLTFAWLGSFSGDQCYFWLGRRFGVRLLDRFDVITCSDCYRQAAVQTERDRQFQPEREPHDLAREEA